MKPIGQQLEALLKKKRMQGQELGQLIGATKVTISHWITGYSKPSYEKLEAISRALGEPITYWFDDDVSGAANTSVASGNGSAASVYGDAIVAGELATYKMENEHLKALLEEKERLIQVLIGQAK